MRSIKKYCQLLKSRLRENLFPLISVITWRVILGVIVLWIAKRSWPLHPTFPYYLSELAHRYPRSLSTFAFFDGIHYLRIAEHGYVDTGTQAFFPLYPLTIRFFHQLTNLDYLNSALILSTCYMLLATLLIWHTFNKQTAKKIILLLLVFPTSFFFASVYTESFFLFLFSLWLYFIKQYSRAHAVQYLLLATAVASTASASRITGLALSLATVYFIYQQAKIQGFKPRDFLLMIFSVLGLLVYMLYLYLKFHDPLMFLHVQSMFGANRSNHLIVPLQTIWRYLKILVIATPTNLIYWRAFFELLTFLWGLWLLVKLYLSTKTTDPTARQEDKRLATSYVIASLIMLSLSAFTGSLSSMPRYFLVILPLVYTWAKLSSARTVFYLTLVALACLQLIGLVLFASGSFVA